MLFLQWKRARSRMLVFVQIIVVSFFAVQSVGSQNSINPRRKSNLTNGVLSCPDLEHDPATECTMSCITDEHCENHGDDLKCCPAAPGSSCKAECKEPVLSLNAAKSCYDFERDRKYSIGDVFETKDGVCCQCILGGFLNCSKTKSCIPGCYYGSKYYQNGDFVAASKCRNCSCLYGAVRCKLNHNCTKDKCKYKGKIYKPDHIIRLDHGCKECVCQLKGWSCTAITCNAERSSSSAVSIQILKTSSLAMLVMLPYFLNS